MEEKMLHIKEVFSSFSVNDLERARKFYSEVIGLFVETTPMGLRLNLAGGSVVFVYPKENHEPATFTVLNLQVENLQYAMEVLKGRGVTFEHYENLTDKDGISRGKANEPVIAWFKDPAGNVLSVLQESP
jgi:predicted enzyme related to lactoylglutathione lyase